MQIELVGCTSAGKSTLAAKLAEAAHADGVDLLLADEFALNRLGLGYLSKRWLRAVVVHIVACWACLSRGWAHRRFVKFSHQQLRQANLPRRQRWNQLRKVLKQLGRYEAIRGAGTNQTPILVDEGTLHAAHNLFVHVGFGFDQEQIREFAEAVPLPDVVVYVRQHEDVLVERALKRGHPRIPHPTRQRVAEFVHQAVAAFDQLAQHERIAPRTLIVQNGKIESEPNQVSTPQMRRALELLRGAIQSGTLPTSNIDFEPKPAAHSGAV